MANNVMYPEEKKSGISLNYEAEYHRLLDENKALRERMLSAEANLREARLEAKILQSQIEIVHLIFGGRANGK